MLPKWLQFQMFSSQCKKWGILKPKAPRTFFHYQDGQQPFGLQNRFRLQLGILKLFQFWVTVTKSVARKTAVTVGLFSQPYCLLAVTIFKHSSCPGWAIQVGGICWRSVPVWVPQVGLQWHNAHMQVSAAEAENVFYWENFIQLSKLGQNKWAFFFHVNIAPWDLGCFNSDLKVAYSLYFQEPHANSIFLSENVEMLDLSRRITWSFIDKSSTNDLASK